MSAVFQGSSPDRRSSRRDIIEAWAPDRVLIGIKSCRGTEESARVYFPHHDSASFASPLLPRDTIDSPCSRSAAARPCGGFITGDAKGHRPGRRGSRCRLMLTTERDVKALEEAPLNCKCAASAGICKHVEMNTSLDNRAKSR